MVEFHISHMVIVPKPTFANFVVVFENWRRN